MGEVGVQDELGSDSCLDGATLLFPAPFGISRCPSNSNKLPPILPAPVPALLNPLKGSPRSGKNVPDVSSPPAPQGVVGYELGLGVEEMDEDEEVRR